MSDDAYLPACPVPHTPGYGAHDHQGNERKLRGQPYFPGLTKREFVAAIIAGGDAANGAEGGCSRVSDEAIQIRARLYVRLADAILDAANE